MLVEKLKTAVVSFSASGNNTIIAAPSQGYIAIDHINFIPSAAVGMKLISGTTDLSGVYDLGIRQGYTMENTTHNQDGIITCKNKEAFIINLDAAVQCSGFCRYRIVGE
jgi:hypothetical protein